MSVNKGISSLRIIQSIQKLVGRRREEGTICYKKDRVEVDEIPYFSTVLILLALSGV
jgi:hypothetical protein